MIRALLVPLLVLGGCARREIRKEDLGSVSQELTCAPSVTARGSVASDGTFSNGFSLGATLNHDARRVAFASLSSNLVAGDTNGTFDVFVRDRVAGETTRVSVSTSGEQANGPSSAPSISADGKLVVFASEATNLVTGDTNGASDIFLRVVDVGQISRLSITSLRTEANGPSFAPSISADGRFVAYHSTATNIVSGDTNGASDIFLIEVATSQVTRVSQAQGGAQGELDSWDPVISGSGAFVVFASDARFLVPFDPNGMTDVFIWLRSTREVALLSTSMNGGPANGRSAAPALSPDGRFLAFESDATNLLIGDTNGATDVFFRDLNGSQTTRVSLSATGAQGSGASMSPTISADGRFVAFASDATNLVPGDGNQKRDIFLRDRTANTTTLVTVPNSGTAADQASFAPKLSGNGLAIAFESSASNLTDGGLCNATDILVRDLVAVPSAWTTGVAYAAGNLVKYTPNGLTYECRQGHTSAVGNEPTVATSIWVLPTPCGVVAWAKQTSYMFGNIVTFNGKKYRCRQSHVSANGLEPENAPTRWELVS